MDAPRRRASSERATVLNFTRILLIGGRCGDPDSWYSKFAAAGVASFPGSQHLCSPYDAGQFAEYSDAFHEKALRDATAAAADSPRQTLVISGAVPAGGAAEDALVNMLRTGVAAIEAFGSGLNLTRHSLAAADVLYVHASPEGAASPDAGAALGRELCRLKGGATRLRVARFYLTGRSDLDFRVDSTLAGFAEACPVGYSDLWSISASVEGATQAVAPYFASKPLPEVILAPNDDSARALLSAARQTLQEEEYSMLGTTGWDNSFPDLVSARKILVTVDQMVFYPNLGMWRTLQQLVQTVQDIGLSSTAAVAAEFDVEGATVDVSWSSASTVSSDPVGLLLEEQMSSYDPRVPPVGRTSVETGLRNVSVTHFTPFDGTFELVYWLHLSWVDPRLEWAMRKHADPIELQLDQIWMPPFLFLNEYSRNTLSSVPAVVMPSGRISVEHYLRSTFLCYTEKGISHFPFDEYDCAASLAVSNLAVSMDGGLGFDVVHEDPNFYASFSTALDADERRDVVLYKLHFTRHSFKMWLRLIVPAILLNLVGFIAFWIPEPADSIALGVTALLCTLALRVSVDMPDTSDVTWSELFMTINVSYQALVCFFSFLDFNGSISRRVQRAGRSWRRGRVRMRRIERSTSQGERNGQGQPYFREREGADEEEPSGQRDGVPRRRKTGGPSDLLAAARASAGVGPALSLRKRRPSPESLAEAAEEPPADIDFDWVGRRIVVPSYVIVVSTMLIMQGKFI